MSRDRAWSRACSPDRCCWRCATAISGPWQSHPRFLEGCRQPDLECREVAAARFIGSRQNEDRSGGVVPLATAVGFSTLQHTRLAMRRPVQCEGIKRGPKRAVQVGVVAAVQPQSLFANLANILKQQPLISPTIRYIT